MANNYPFHIEIDVSIESENLFKAICTAEIISKYAFGTSARIKISYDGKQKSFDEVNEDE